MRLAYEAVVQSGGGLPATENHSPGAWTKLAFGDAVSEHKGRGANRPGDINPLQNGFILIDFDFDFLILPDR